MPGRYCGSQRADPGRNTHGSGKDIIDQEGRGCQQAGKSAEVLSRDRIGTPATGIGCDCLPVREEDNDQQRDDAEREGSIEERPAAPRGSSKVRAASAGSRADLLGAFFGRSKRPSDQEIENGWNTHGL